MLRIVVPETELWDEQTGEFINIKEQKLQLEHSLISLSKWESTWRKSFLSRKDKSREEIIDYIKCMTITQNVDSNVYRCLTSKNIEEIQRYLEEPMCATYLPDEPNGQKSTESITSELIYYWMIALNIPFECQKWHLNKLLALIKVCNIKNQPNKKMGSRALINKHRSVNAARRAKRPQK